MFGRSYTSVTIATKILELRAHGGRKVPLGRWLSFLAR